MPNKDLPKNRKVLKISKRWPRVKAPYPMLDIELLETIQPMKTK